MKYTSASGQELYHEIFGSILDRAEMTPYLLLRATNYETALRQATKMMGNRGFDTLENADLQQSELERARTYVRRSYEYLLNWMFPFSRKQLEGLVSLSSANTVLYRNCLRIIAEIEAVLKSDDFLGVVNGDPRHLFLLASSRKYPQVFYGYRGENIEVPDEWQQTACSILKTCQLIKLIEEVSQDINDYAQLGFFLQMQGQSLDDLYNYHWENPGHLPSSEPAQRAFVKISTFFHKLKASMLFDTQKGCLVFNSGDGVEVDISEIKARLKSPESMFTKLGKNVEGEVYDIRDILAITFILKTGDDTLKLFHALQKRGVILQENTASHSITQTLFDTPKDMMEATRRLMISLSRSEGGGGNNETPCEEALLADAKKFYEALNVNAAKNRHSSSGHKKFQCKITFSLPVHREAGTNKILIPGTPAYVMRERISKITQQHTLGVELRISDEQSWRASEQKGESHHDAYKFRQVVSLMNRVFQNRFHLPKESFEQLRRDQAVLFHS
jgi:uncharacterized protein (TIGR04562 family)